jgi:RNA polymerase sigma-70 factor (ECF subfamily)
MREVLVRAVARHAPPWLAAQREDLVQTAMLRLLELERQPGGDAVKTPAYLWKVAYSVVVDEMRRRRREREGPLEEAGDPSSPASAESGLTDREIGLALRGCLGGMAADRRVAVMLHLQGHSLADGATLAGWNLKRHTNLVYRGLTDLKRCLMAKGIRP